MNLRQDFRKVKQFLIEQWWMFNKIHKQREENAYKEKPYNRLIIRSAFFFFFRKSITWSVQAMMLNKWNC